MTGAQIVLAILGSSGVTGSLTILLRAFLDRRSKAAETARDEAEAHRADADADKSDADLTAVLTGGSIKLVEQYVRTNTELRTELAEVKRDMSARINNLEHKLDQVLDVVQQEQRYVTAHGFKDAPVLTKLHGLAI